MRKFVIALALLVSVGAYADDVVLVDHLRFAAGIDHEIKVDPVTISQGKHLHLRAGSTNHTSGIGGTLDLSAGGGPLSMGSIGIGRAAGSSQIITIGCCTNTETPRTEQVHVRGDDLLFTGVQDATLQTKTGDLVLDGYAGLSLRLNGAGRIAMVGSSTVLYYGSVSHLSLNSTGMYVGDEGSKLRFFGDDAAAITRPTVTGSRSSGAACTDLLNKLDALGLIDDQSTP